MENINYKMGWIMVAFDLPVKDKEERKTATRFREWLLDDGYQMMQFSVYIRPCVTYARMETHIRRVKAVIPNEGEVRVLFITKAQWERSHIIRGRPNKPEDPEKMPEQILLW
jgi:CRISPR-associated protein Cas2